MKLGNIREAVSVSKSRITPEEALAFHLEPMPGKFEISATVPMTTQRDLSLAYSPGVAVPCEAIADNPELAYDYTNKGNFQRYSGSGAGEPGGARVKAGDGRQSGFVQAVRRREFD